jgi:hypothetical protein
MEDTTFQIKNLEFHLKQVSMSYDKCIAKAIRSFLESDTEFNIHMKPCESIKANLDGLMKKYEEINSNKC